MSREDSQPMARRKFLTAATSAATSLAVAGCSDSGSQDGPETQVDDSETSDSSTPNQDTGSGTSPETDADGENPTSEETAQEEWEDHSKVERYKRRAEPWIEIPVGNLELPSYDSSQEVAQYAPPGQSEHTDNLVVNSDSEVQVDLSQDGIEHIRQFVANNIFEGNREDSVSVLLTYEEPTTSVIEEEYEELSWMFGMPVIPSRLSELDYTVGDNDYPIDNEIEGHLFDEGAMETFFQDYVSGVRDSSDVFPDELLEYAEQ